MSDEASVPYNTVLWYRWDGTTWWPVVLLDPTEHADFVTMDESDVANGMSLVRFLGSGEFGKVYLGDAEAVELFLNAEQHPPASPTENGDLERAIVEATSYLGFADEGAASAVSGSTHHTGAAERDAERRRHREQRKLEKARKKQQSKRERATAAATTTADQAHRSRRSAPQRQPTLEESLRHRHTGGGAKASARSRAGAEDESSTCPSWFPKHRMSDGELLDFANQVRALLEEATTSDGQRQSEINAEVLSVLRRLAAVDVPIRQLVATRVGFCVGSCAAHSAMHAPVRETSAAIVNFWFARLPSHVKTALRGRGSRVAGINDARINDGAVEGDAATMAASSVMGATEAGEPHQHQEADGGRSGDGRAAPLHSRLGEDDRTIVAVDLTQTIPMTQLAA